MLSCWGVTEPGVWAVPSLISRTQLLPILCCKVVLLCKNVLVIFLRYETSSSQPHSTDIHLFSQILHFIEAANTWIVYTSSFSRTHYDVGNSETLTPLKCKLCLLDDNYINSCLLHIYVKFS